LLSDNIVQSIGVGYSGSGGGKNNSAAQELKSLGPIPIGNYKIGAAFTHKTKGPVCMRLTPAKTNNMFGRRGFMIHGDSIARPGTASTGCIILARFVRQLIDKSKDKDLQVIV
jgi:hypothetical protein